MDIFETVKNIKNPKCAVDIDESIKYVTDAYVRGLNVGLLTFLLRKEGINVTSQMHKEIFNIHKDCWKKIRDIVEPTILESLPSEKERYKQLYLDFKNL